MPSAPVAARARHVAWRLRRELRDRVIGSGALDVKTRREDVALRYLGGEGIEIGAFDFPLRMPAGARVRYVDFQSGEELRRTYAALLEEGRPLVVPDVVDDGERLATFADGSLDFVVANHMLEHAEDPIGALTNHLRVLRPGGILFLALPDARHTFDAGRERTTVAHLRRDHRDGPEGSRRGHYEEWARVAERREDGIEQRVAELEAEHARIHFHVWEPLTFAELLRELRGELPFELELLEASGHEFLVVLRRV